MPDRRHLPKNEPALIERRYSGKDRVLMAGVFGRKSHGGGTAPTVRERGLVF